MENRSEFRNVKLETRADSYENEIGRASCRERV